MSTKRRHTAYTQWVITSTSPEEAQAIKDYLRSAERLRTIGIVLHIVGAKTRSPLPRGMRDHTRHVANGRVKGIYKSKYNR